MKNSDVKNRTPKTVRTDTTQKMTMGWTPGKNGGKLGPRQDEHRGVKQNLVGQR